MQLQYDTDSLFIAGQWVAWNQLHAEHVFFRSNPSSHFFYLITGVHAVHLFLGIFALIGWLIPALALLAFSTAAARCSESWVGTVRGAS